MKSLRFFWKINRFKIKKIWSWLLEQDIFIFSAIVLFSTNSQWQRPFEFLRAPLEMAPEPWAPEIQNAMFLIIGAWHVVIAIAAPLSLLSFLKTKKFTKNTLFRIRTFCIYFFIVIDAGQGFVAGGWCPVTRIERQLFEARLLFNSVFFFDLAWLIAVHAIGLYIPLLWKPGTSLGRITRRDNFNLCCLGIVAFGVRMIYAFSYVSW